MIKYGLKINVVYTVFTTASPIILRTLALTLSSLQTWFYIFENNRLYIIFENNSILLLRQRINM